MDWKSSCAVAARASISTGNSVDAKPAAIGDVTAGLHGNRFGMGPIVGRILADLVTSGATSHDPSAFRAKRFSGLMPMSG